MKINFYNLKITKDFLNRKSCIKDGLLNYVNKIIIQNQNTPQRKKTSIIFKKKSYKYAATKQINRCLYTSKAGTNFKLTNYSRHIIKKKLIQGILQNVKVDSY